VEIGQWLRGLGLQSYEQAFRDNGIDLDILPRLTADDLKEIGVLAVGHRRRQTSRPQWFRDTPNGDSSR
jgi:hypothetical protein